MSLTIFRSGIAAIILFSLVACSSSKKMMDQKDTSNVPESMVVDKEPWLATEVWEPEPAIVSPATKGEAPSDAIVLFDGTNLNEWHKPKHAYGGDMKSVRDVMEARKISQIYTEPEWNVKDGAMIVKPGGGPIESKQSFRDMQLHIEWLAPEDKGKEGQLYSNSGIFLMATYEIQVLNSYENRTYSNGQAGAMYKQGPPLVNASKPPGEWQTYDIIFKAPTFDVNGNVTDPARITALHNGILIQNDFEIKGPCLFIGEPSYIAHPDRLPIILQDHGDKVRFRNIWVREL